MIVFFLHINTSLQPLHRRTPKFQYFYHGSNFSLAIFLPPPFMVTRILLKIKEQTCLAQQERYRENTGWDMTFCRFFLKNRPFADSFIESRCPWASVSVPFHAIFFACNQTGSSIGHACNQTDSSISHTSILLHA